MKNPLDEQVAISFNYIVSILEKLKSADIIDILYVQPDRRYILKPGAYQISRIGYCKGDLCIDCCSSGYDIAVKTTDGSVATCGCVIGKVTTEDELLNLASIDDFVIEQYKINSGVVVSRSI